jgi:hypothetical protein
MPGRSRDVCQKSGCELLEYEKARRALIRLPDRNKVAILVEAASGVVHQSRGFLDLILETRPIGSWHVHGIHHETASEPAQGSLQAVDAAMLDVLIQKIARCTSVGDVALKSSTGALDPSEEVFARVGAAKL